MDFIATNFIGTEDIAIHVGLIGGLCYVAWYGGYLAGRHDKRKGRARWTASE